MAQAELKTFVEDRLQALVPGIDVSAGSPAQTTFVDPLMQYLGTDPFETDIDKFLSDRFRQEYPDIYAGDPSAIRDLFVKPLITFLEPIKREILTVRRNQSLQDPALLSDDDADALVANFYDQRAQGALAGGTVRAYYSNPANVPIETTVRFSTAGGLAFFPTAPTSITAEEMVFNRDGTLYYADIPVKAEKEGAAYNVGVGTIVNVDGLFGIVKVSNLQVFQSGADKISTDAFVSQSREALNERSLLNRRGAVPRLRDAFPGQLRAVQVIGAQDKEMERDILVGHTKGHTWLTGRVTLYESMALVQARTVDDGAESAPVAGDTLYVYLDKTTWPSGILQKDRFVELTVEETILDGIGGSGAFQCSFLVRWSGSLPTGILAPLSVEGGCTRKGTISITSIPGIGALTADVPDQSVHIYGHTDIYVRPTADVVSKSVLSPVVDASPVMEYTTLSTAATVPTNSVLDSVGRDFAVAGVLPGDVLYIESSDAAGTYTIADVTGSGSGSRLLLATNIERAATNARYRISRTVKVDLFSPKIPKLPFSNLPADDLTTQIGSLLFSFSTNTVDYGVRIGDTVRVTSGPDVGDFTITGFDGVLGGRGVLVDRRATASVAGVKYEIFTLLEPVQKPLIRLKEVMLLDSSKKATGVTVPPALPVAVRSLSDFTSASAKGRSYQNGGIVLPKLDTLFTTTNVPAINGDMRYSTGSEPADGGSYKAFELNYSGHVEGEILVPSSAYSECSWFLALVEDVDAVSGKPPVVFEVGGVLNLLSGPNKGGYLIREVKKVRYYPIATPTVPYWLTFVRIHGTFPVDTFRSVIDFIAANPVPITGFPGIPTLRAEIDGTPVLETWFGDFWANLPTWVNGSIGLLGGSPPSTTVAAIDTLLATDYEVGTPARGILRSYFQQPTLFTQNTAGSPTPTVYDFKAVTGDILSFRPDPFRYEEQNILPAREVSDVDVFSSPRDVLPSVPTAASGTSAVFSLTDKPSIFSIGVRPGDVLELYEEKPFFDPNDYAYLVGVSTEADSPRVTRPASAPAFTSMLGGLLFSIVDGPDAGLYRIVDVPDSYTLVLDRPLTTSTQEVLAHASSVSYGYVGTEDRIGAPGIDFSQHIDRYVSLYCVQASTYRIYLAGTYRIMSVVSGDVHIAVVDRPTLFVGAYQADARACVVITDAPPSAPEARAGAQSGTGTEVVGVRLARFYQDLPTLRTIVSVGTNITTSTVTVDTAFGAGINNPYRIYRKDIRRVGAMEMLENKENSLYYFDTEVLSLSSSPAANIPVNSYLVPREGTFASNGYKHIVDDRTLTFSTKEEGKLELPLRIIPSFSADRLDNSLSIPGASLQITYDMSTVVDSVQTFIGSVEDRVTAANMLARHFLPSYASYDATYIGGSTPDIVAKDIISYIESLAVETPLDVSVVQDLIAKRGGNLLTPSAVVTIMHDWSRRMWMEMSANQLGGTGSAVPYDGSSRVTFFIPGADISLKTSEPYGERIKLVRK
jgi:hypothetical protein